MDFGDILRQWESSARIHGSQKQERKQERMKGHESGNGEAGKGSGFPDKGTRNVRTSQDREIPDREESCDDEAETPQNQTDRDSLTARRLAAWLDTHTIPDKDAPESDSADTSQAKSRARSRREESRRTPDATLDLHGKTANEAVALVNGFLERCAREGKEHVLIIHGKGMHSADGPVLDAVVRKVLETSPVAGMHGEAHRSLGGGGATWVRVRGKYYFSR